MVTAEEAVNVVFSTTGARAAQLPELVTARLINGRPAGAVWCPVWRVALERPVRLAALYSLRQLDLRDVYVGDAACPGLLGRTSMLTPWIEQPQSREFVLVSADSTSPGGFRRIVHVAQYRVPVDFESVIIAK
jgi:hypothetical protein